MFDRLRHFQAMLSPLRFGSVRARTPLVTAGQRIGLMGGSFNPPHEGHVAVAEAALKRLKLDRIWWIVSPGNPLKGHDGLPPLAERLEACRLLARNPRIRVTGLEALLGSPYSAVTVAFLKARHPGVRFVWVMGADNLASFHRWRDWRAVARRVTIAVVDRPGWRFMGAASRFAGAFARCRLPEAAAGLLAHKTAPRWVMLSTHLSGQSSTALRARRDRPMRPGAA